MEYAFLLVAIAVPAMAGIGAGGVAMVREYNAARSAILRPMP
ncbi:MAG: hypothetical protein R3B36_25125 [Polyangiaceae bacterium]